KTLLIIPATPADRIASEFNGERYVELFFRVHLKRKTLYYGLNWIIPSILISISNVLGFTMPPECGEKITLRKSNHESSLRDRVPRNGLRDHSTHFGIDPYNRGILLTLNALIGLLYHSDVSHYQCSLPISKTHQMGKWIQLIFLEWLPWFLLMSRPGKKFTRRRQKSPSENGDEPFRKTAGKHVVMIDDEQNSRFLNGGIPGMEKVKALRPHLIRRSETFAVDDSIEMGIREIIALLNAFKDRLDEEDRDSDLQADWKFMAMVIDRLSLFLFTVLIVATTSLIFLSTPRLFVKSPVY
ncbi:Neurotransmitter-gated ion-channel transmembrane region, partial [Ostertagia ostertagi]